jgi:hypothetical protein
MEPLMWFALAQAEHRARVAHADKFGHQLAALTPARPRRRRSWSWPWPPRDRAVVPAIS